MCTDKFVYLLFQLLLQGFFTLIGRDPSDALNYDFKSVELKETAFRIDGVFTPKNNDDEVYFVEAQFQADETFYARFFAEIFLYLKQYRVVEWRAVVIYPSRSVEPKRVKAYGELLESKRVVRVYLDELSESEEMGVELFKVLMASEEEMSVRAER